MTTVATLLTLITHAQQHVAALESLAAGMAAGLRAGMVDADHVYTLMATQTRAINAQLDQVATGDGERTLADAYERQRRTTSKYCPNGWHRREKVILVITLDHPLVLSASSKA